MQLLIDIFHNEIEMAETDSLTITLPSDMAAIVKRAVEGGDYASTSAVMHEAISDWTTKRALQLTEMQSLKTDIEEGIRDLTEGRVKDFDHAAIIERGRTLLAGR